MKDECGFLNTPVKYVFVISGLQNKQLCNESATALLSICASCKTHMTSHFQTLTEVMKERVLLSFT